LILLYHLQNAAAESDEEDDLNQLQVIEQKLLAYDPTFTHHHTHASIATQRSALISAFRPLYEEGDLEGELLCVSRITLDRIKYAGHTRIHLNTERWRVCETWFSPGMAGVDSAGLGEVLQNVLAGFPDHEKARLVQVGVPPHWLSVVSTNAYCSERLRHRFPISPTRPHPAIAKHASADSSSGNATQDCACR
jgi:hypothetical protein